MNEESQNIMHHQALVDSPTWYRCLSGDSFQGYEDGDGEVRDFHRVRYTSYLLQGNSNYYAIVY